MRRAVDPRGAGRDARGVHRHPPARARPGAQRGRVDTGTAIDVRVIDGHTAIIVSTAGILMPGAQSVPDEHQRTATWVLSKQDGEWLIAAYTNTPVH